MASESGDETLVACCFCSEGINRTEQDPIGLGVIERWQADDEAIDWMTYAHRRCFVERLEPESRALAEESPSPWWLAND